MNREERIEKLAEYIEAEGWVGSPRKSSIKAELLLDFLATLGACWRAEDQSIPELYEENFAHGMNLPTPRDIDLLRQGMEWLKHEGFVKVEDK